MRLPLDTESRFYLAEGRFLPESKTLMLDRARHLCLDEREGLPQSSEAFIKLAASEIARALHRL